MGELNTKEYKEVKSLIEKALDTTIPGNKSILIHYSQAADNCIFKDYSENDVINSTEKGIKFSNEISSSNNTVDFFVYSENSCQKPLLQKNKNYIKDSGFFYDTIFTLHENCEAFLILKPNGEFLKYYGFDYFSEVRAFLENNYVVKE